MKQSSQYFTSLFIFLLLLLLISSSNLLSTTFWEANHGLSEITTSEASVDNLEASASVHELMGLERCGKEGDIGGDEECLKRRIMAEAHLDYIYTQGLNP